MLIYLLVFVSGSAITVMEITLARFIQPYLGNSTIIWGHVISITMLTLSLGYFLGGWLAKKIHHHKKLPNSIPALLGASGILMAFAYVLSKIFILPRLLIAIDNQEILLIYVLFIFVLILFSISLVPLAGVAPVAIQYLGHNKDIGNTAGNVYFLNTVGSLLGIFLPGLLLIPLLGTAFVIITLATSLAMAWIYYHRLFVVLALTFLTLFLFPLSNKTTDGVIFETESAYNYLQIVQKAGRNFLRINEGQAEHSIYDPHSVLVGGVWDYYSVIPTYLSQFKKTAIVGLAGGTISHALSHYYPDSTIDGIEIDPAIIDIGKKYFTLNDPQLSIHHADGRIFLAQSEGMYDLICLDAYKQPYIPYNLTTKEFFSLVKSKLDSHGIMAMNIGTAGESDLLASLEYTVKQVFPYTRIVHIPNTYNYLLLASREPFTPKRSIHTDLIPMLAVLENPIQLADNLLRVIFTDDKAPIEFFTDTMIWKVISR